MHICGFLPLLLLIPPARLQDRSSYLNCSVAEQGRIRLSNGTSKFEGRLEMCLDGSWGTVCDDGWSVHSHTGRRNARVVCQQLGEQLGVTIVDSITRLNIWQSYNDPLPIHMQYVSCTAGDDSLMECQFTRLANSAGCSHYEDVGLSCVPANSSLLPECTEEQFQCENGLCINSIPTPSLNLVCDGLDDCGDNSDENNTMCMEIRDRNRQKVEDSVKTAASLAAGVSIGVSLGIAFIWLAVLGLCCLVPGCPFKKMYFHKQADPHVVREEGTGGSRRLLGEEPEGEEPDGDQQPEGEQQPEREQDPEGEKPGGGD